MGLFHNRQKTIQGEHVPVWFMRQAGRYHNHYQNLKKQHNFMELCMDPELATQVTLGPINDFQFDAAIMFSDLLFPLDAMGMGLTYENGPPELAFHVQEEKDLKKLSIKSDLEKYFHFQKQTIINLKKELPPHVDTLGFVGGPFTLYTYATEGSHSGLLSKAKTGLYNGLYSSFCEFLYPVLFNNMKEQAKGNPDAICLFDTAAGELCPADFSQFVLPLLEKLLKSFKAEFPTINITYYAKYATEAHLRLIENLPIDVLGVDWRHDLPALLKKYGQKFYIQGNIDPVWLHLPWEHLENNLKTFYNKLKSHDVPLDKWICGLGHGVNKETPQDNVKKFVELVHKNYVY